MNGSKYLWGWMIAISVLFAAVLFYISYHISQVKEIPVGSGEVETAMSLIDQNLYMDWYYSCYMYYIASCIKY